ncbi:MAG: UDP-N-acetylmuramoyl-L-alanine--D-glutamate ligase [Proteobacteria bacterium]|nr:UDP-N-acetylmuramoyl-L-alanine--D-glutamate ligase [Pseudomonadota bacterium]
MKQSKLISAGTKVAILGLGISGRAAAKYALQCGAEVRVSDIRTEQQFVAEEGAFLSATGVSWEAGGHTYDFLQQADVVLVSPGVDLASPLIKSLQVAGVKLAGELAVAAGQLQLPVVAITGTNGKTTVTTLIGELLSASGKKVFVGGNIGIPLYEFLCHQEKYDMAVVEVSSFQLESAGNFSADVGVLLNITPDHLDRHGSLEAYGRLKMQLFAHKKEEALAVINGDDSLCLELSKYLTGDVQTFGVAKTATAVIDRDLIRLTLAEKTEEYPLAATALANSVGLRNSAAAILAARRLGCTPEQILQGLQKFRLLPHRIEFVAEVEGVGYYNDSKATNTGAVLGALEQFPGNVILIAGGRDKGDDYRLLRKAVTERVRQLVVIGEAAVLLEEALADVVTTLPAQSMQEAVTIAAGSARPGDVVLLSPACASFDMFTSYGHRGNEFKKEVLALQAARKKILESGKN